MCITRDQTENAIQICRKKRSSERIKRNYVRVYRLSIVNRVRFLYFSPCYMYECEHVLYKAIDQLDNHLASLSFSLLCLCSVYGIHKYIFFPIFFPFARSVVLWLYVSHSFGAHKKKTAKKEEIKMENAKEEKSLLNRYTHRHDGIKQQQEQQ